MKWHELHAELLSKAFEKVLGATDKGAIAFVRCLTPQVVLALASDQKFVPHGWQVWRVAETNDGDTRTITADQAVEIRESKAEAVLMLVDTDEAGAGTDDCFQLASTCGLYRPRQNREAREAQVLIRSQGHIQGCAP